MKSKCSQNWVAVNCFLVFPRQIFIIFMLLMADRCFPILNVRKKWKDSLDIHRSLLNKIDFPRRACAQQKYYLLISLL